MTFREEYRKSNDSIHAPLSILDSVKEKASAEAAEEPISLFETKPKRRWISIATYSGVAVAAAALVLLIVNPFRNAKSAAAPTNAAGAAYASDTVMMSSSMVAEAAAETESYPVSESLVSSFSAARSDSKNAQLEDGEPEELFPATVDELTYHDIYSWLVPSHQDNNTAKKATAPVLLTKESGAWFSGNVITAGDDTIDLPMERTLVALADLSGKILAVSQSENTVYVTAIERTDGKLVITDEASQSGIFESCLLHESTIFEEDLLVTYPVFEVTTIYAVDVAAASESEPLTFCPAVSDPSGSRVLDPNEIVIYDAGNEYTLYTGYECGKNLRILYAFAEFGLE